MKLVKQIDVNFKNVTINKMQDQLRKYVPIDKRKQKKHLKRKHFSKRIYIGSGHFKFSHLKNVMNVTLNLTIREN